jgi:hypothetical protein
MFGGMSRPCGPRGQRPVLYQWLTWGGEDQRCSEASTRGRLQCWTEVLVHYGELGRCEERIKRVACKAAPGGGVFSGSSGAGRSRIMACLFVAWRLEWGDAMVESFGA